jgi:hypothetical protein
MNWRNIFKPADILTAGDRAELEKIDKKATQHRALIERIRDEWPTANERMDALERLGQKLAEAPTDEALFHRCTMVAAMPSDPLHGYQHRDKITAIIHRKIEEILHPQEKIVRRVLGRALDAAETELKKSEAAEKGQAKEEGFDYSPSGRVLALQKRVLDLRNAAAALYPSEEGFISHPGEWQERLREWL